MEHFTSSTASQDADTPRPDAQGAPDAGAHASTVNVLRQIRALGINTSAVREKVERLEQEWELVSRQLDGFERPVAPYLGIDATEWVEPASDRYRERLLGEKKRLIAELEFWSMAARHLTA